MCSACAIIRPSGSNSAVEQSRRSLMLAECAARISAAPISSATPRSAEASTCSVGRIAHRVTRQPPSPAAPCRPARRHPQRRTIQMQRCRPWHRPLARGTHQLQRRPCRGAGGPQVDQLDRRPALLVAVPLGVSLVEPLGQGRQRLQVDLQLEPLPRVAQVGPRPPLRAALRLRPRHLRPDLRPRQLLQRPHHAAHGVPSPLSGGDAERRQHSAGGGHAHRPHPQLLGHLAGVQRARAAEGDQLEPARVVTPLHLTRP